jgi:hypothetical protein
MDAEQTIAEIEWLERIVTVPDTRPFSASDLAAANRVHDEKLANSPWFPAVAAVWHLLRDRVPDTPAGRKRELTPSEIRICTA